MTANPDGPRGAAGRGPGRRPGRRPGPTETREAILTAARDLFADKGYDGVSVRAIGRSAGVDPALVHHFFGTKEQVFVAAMRFPVQPTEVIPRIMGGDPDKIGETLARTFLNEWEDPERRAPVIALVRSAMTNDQAAALLREFVERELFGRAAELTDLPPLRLNAAIAQMVGIVLMRYVLQAEPVASAGVEELVELLAPTLQRYLT